ncbi:aminopeptidase [Candidatus Woesearchaeota archaeon]|nr:aminopeptidase [Candidatus Woesearchaeota archaeon]
MDENMNKAASITLNSCLKLKKTETLLIITDRKKKKIAKEIYYAAFYKCRNSMLVTIPEAEVSGEEPPAIVAEVMKKYDVIIAPTSKSITHTNAISDAMKKGARVASLPGITEGAFKRGLTSDYTGISITTRKLASMIMKSKRIRIITSAGTDIRAEVSKDYLVFYDDGLITKKGSRGNLPAGEAFFVPKYKKTQGTFVVDASFGIEGKVDKPVKVTVKDGYAVRIQGGKTAAELRKILKKCGKNAYNIAEVGIGTNPYSRISGIVLEDEKVLGTAHIALGNSKGMGGPTYAPCHLDGVFRKPTIYLDDRIVMDKGKLVI